MIQLTRLNNSPFMVNSDLIKFVEQSPDTVITLLNNEKILVREKADAVLERIIRFRQAILAGHAESLVAEDKPADAETPSER
ncbi:MAG TPA: flagellar FlbD family protein [Terriglobales bacterium]|nr:flagellar FlbD family protein [Terriglobales bacterium]